MSEKEPTPPANLPFPELELGKDTLGREIIRNEHYGLKHRFELDSYEREQGFLDDLKTFYGISDDEIGEQTVEELDEKHEFPDDVYDFFKRDYWLDQTIANKRENNRSNYDIVMKRRSPDTNMEYAVASLRGQLSELFEDPRTAQLVEDEFNSPVTHVPKFINLLRRDQNGNLVSWTEWLSEKATHQQFMNFLQWHNHHMVELQKDPELANLIAQEKREYKEAVQKGMDEGWLPDDAQVAINYTTQTKVNIVDIFGTLAQGIAGYHISSYWQRKGNDVYLAQGMIKEATKHELNHSVLGNLPYPWLNEAATEHIAVSMKQGKFADFLEHLKHGVYIHERHLVDIILKEGSKEIPPELVTRAYASSEHDGMAVDRPSKDRAALAQAVYEAWGSDILQKVDDAIARETRTYMEQGEPHGTAYILALETVGGQLLSTPEEVTG